MLKRLEKYQFTHDDVKVVIPLIDYVKHQKLIRGFDLLDVIDDYMEYKSKTNNVCDASFLAFISAGRFIMKTPIVDDIGYVYLLSTKQGTKIGRSKTPEVRHQNLKSGIPQPLTGFRSFKVVSDVKVEKILHREFKHKNIHGEWFELNDKEIAIIEKIIIKYQID